MNKLPFSRSLMIVTILLLAIFEGYWLNRLYKDERKSLQNNLDVVFHGAIEKLQKSRYARDSSLLDTNVVYSTANKDLNTGKRRMLKDHIKNPMLAFHRIDPATELKDIHPEAIKSISIVSANEFNDGVPPPGLVEVLMKAGLAASDSGNRIILQKISSAYEIRRQNKEAASSIVIRFKGDSAFSGKSMDSAVQKYRSNLPLQKVLDSLKEWKATRRQLTFKQTNTSTAERQIRLIDSGIRATVASDNFQKAKASPIFKLLINNKTVNDSLPVKSVDSVYRYELRRVLNKYPPYRIVFTSYADSVSKEAAWKKDTSNNKDEIVTKVVTGFSVPYTYEARFDHVGTFILKKIQLPIIGYLFLLLFVVFSFAIMYSSLLEQQRLALIKNDFISNITHELKTPIATVNVAIEALRNFNAIENPAKTKEYLDISASELQRLGLLVDKVLKLSMFESKKVALKKETFDFKLLVEETLNTMRLQFEKQKAIVTLDAADTSFLIDADKLHITSVIYNLLDNALKYSDGQPVIHLSINMLQSDSIELRVADQGIGIAHQYQPKIFDKFFRVPMGNKHNIKGYGLGLSYVAEIVKRHHGMIYVESILDKGSTFIVTLPLKSEDSLN